VSAVALVIVATVALAVVLAVLLPGAGLVGAIVVVLVGLGVVAWLVLAGASRTAPSDAARRTEDAELLGPGGPDDPRTP
jgi:hypothetical protein